jgi:endonuclease/exonuclease/phosphatase family metal-dependent hydrolase
MKKNISSILIGCTILILSSAACSPLNKSIEKKQSTVKLLTYNVRNCRGMDDITDYKRIADIISRIAPDVVMLQELDSATQRSNGKVVLNELASFTKMYNTYGASIAYQGGKYGIGILTKEKPVKWEVVALPGREERRSLLILELNDYYVCCTHFSLNEEDRLASVDIINNSLKDFSKPVFLAGDFNAAYRSQVINTIQTKWLILNNPELPTIPSNNPQRCIDYIFASNNQGYTFKTKQTFVENEPLASDHLPVWVIVNILKGNN